MSKKKNPELSRMWGFAGKRHWLTIASVFWQECPRCFLLFHLSVSGL